MFYLKSHKVYWMGGSKFFLIFPPKIVSVLILIFFWVIVCFVYNLLPCMFLNTHTYIKNL